MRKADLPTLLPGDILLSRTDSFISRAIRFFTSLWDKEPDKVSHVAMSLMNGEVVESLWYVKRRSLESYLADGKNKKFIILRNRLLPESEREGIALRALGVENQPYGILKIFLYVLDTLFHTYLFSKLFGLSNFKVCSNLIAYCYYKNFSGLLWIGEMRQRFAQDLSFGVPWRSTRPDTIYDWALSHPSEWGVIFSNL